MVSARLPESSAEVSALPIHYSRFLDWLKTDEGTWQINHFIVRSKRKNVKISIRPLLDTDLDEVDQIYRLAFGTFLGLTDPLQFGGDTDTIRTRWKADPSAALGAEVDGRLVGTNFLAKWGSVGLFGPLTIHPDFWDRGIAQDLLRKTMGIFDRWAVTQACLFTHAESPKHVALYQKFGFWPRFLTAIMSTSLQTKDRSSKAIRFSGISEGKIKDVLAQCSQVTNLIYQGLDVRREIIAVFKQKLGDTLLFWNSTELSGFAVCHCGHGTEAGTGACYVKFAAVAPGPDAESHFVQLLQSCETFAASQGLERLIAGINTARYSAYTTMIARGYRTFRLGVAMHKSNEPGYNRDGIYVIDDWR